MPTSVVSLRSSGRHGNYDGRMMGHSENYIRVAQPYDEAAIGTTTRITPQHLDESGTFVY